MQKILQLGPKRVMPLPVIEEKWRALSLPIERFQELVRIGSFSGEVEWLKFFAAAASTLGEATLFFRSFLILSDHTVFILETFIIG